MDASVSLSRLKEGNARFVAGRLQQAVTPEDRARLADGQKPFAIVLGCSDSRVPTEMVFDQGPGGLFVIRVAGNVVAPSQLGSIEFAVMQFATPLVVVLGHTRCGAINATLEQLVDGKDPPSPNIASITGRILPVIQPLVEAAPGEKDQQARTRLSELAVRANIRAAVNQLGQSSPLLKERVDKGLLRVIGAEYSLASGEVAFLD